MAGRMVDYLEEEEELEGELRRGWGKEAQTDGSTRMTITAQMEGFKLKMLSSHWRSRRTGRPGLPGHGPTGTS